MNKMLVAVFDDEEKAYEGSRVLRELCEKGIVIVYAVAVIVKDSGVNVQISQVFGQGPLGVLRGTATASLVELLSRLIVGTFEAGGSLVSPLIDNLANVSVGADFVDEAAHYLKRGKSAVVAEIEEERVMPADVSLERVGGIVLRRPRSEVVGIQIQKEIAAFQEEIENLEAELEQMNSNTKAKLKEKIGASRARLEAAKDWARCHADGLKREAEAKIIALQERAAHSHGDLRAKFEKLVGQVRADYAQRATQLNRSCEPTKGALTA